MKTIRLMSEIAGAALVAFLVLFASCERVDAQNTQSNGFVFPAIGTVSNVTAYAVAHVNVIGVDIWVWNTNNAAWKAYFVGVWYASTTNYVTSKTQMDHQIIGKQITNIVSQIITNTDPTIDKSRGVLVYAACSYNTNGYTSYQSMETYQVVPLPKNQDGSYGLPDLSSFSTSLADSIPFYIPNLQWARLEIGYKGDSYPFEVDDKLYDSTTDPIGSDGFLYLPGYITNSATSGGIYWMKITLFDTNTFQIFNGDGNPIPESPLQPEISQDASYAYITVNGGDSGRGYMLQSSSELIHWTNGAVQFVSPLPGLFPPTFYWPLATAHQIFFRTATTNTVPTD